MCACVLDQRLSLDVLSVALHGLARSQRGLERWSKHYELRVQHTLHDPSLAHQEDMSALELWALHCVMFDFKLKFLEMQ